MKPPKELREKFATDYYDRSAFASKSRLLQSIWRTEKGYEYEKYGNFLELHFAKESGANFLTKEIFELVKHEVANKHLERKVIKEPRIWDNLLSSQPLAFNLFGELKLDLGLATLVFKDLYPERQIDSVTAIEFEYSPKSPSKQTDQVTEQVENLLSVMDKEYSTSELMEILNLSHREHFRANILQKAVDLGLVELTILDKPTSSKQKNIDLQKKELHIKLKFKYYDHVMDKCSCCFGSFVFCCQINYS